MDVILALALAATTTTVASAADQPISSYDPPSLVRYLQQEGYTATLGSDGEGDPKIESAAGGTRFQIFFYGCTKHVRCSDLSFHAGYDFAVGKEPKPEAINDYNRDFRFARAYIDKEKDPHLNMDVVFTDGQMPTKMFKEHLDIWNEAMGDFEKGVDW